MIKDLYQSADWKKEKHAPAIDILEKETDKKVKIEVSVGKDIAHPNTSAHHIVWIDVYFLPEGSKFPYQIGRYDFLAHGASIEGPDTSSVYTEPVVQLTMKTSKGGTIFASSYCNIHGLWESSLELRF
ncbi:MAG: superoxide reductase [Elusimicrobia bacterium]|nr:superoxide reductase [Elusimicrobiota bacterium]